MNKNNRIRLANQVIENNALIVQLEQVDFDANPYVKELIERLSKVNTYLLHDVFKLITLDERLSSGIDHIRQYTSTDGLENLKINKNVYNLSDTLSDVLAWDPYDSSFTDKERKLIIWITDNLEEFVRAWLDGYSVEGEATNG